MTESYMFKLFSDDHIQFIDENASKLKVHFSIDETTETIQLKLQPFSKIVWSGRYLARPKIHQEVLSQVRSYLEVPNDLQLQPIILDQSRMHPRYAMNFNRRYDLLHQLLFNGESKTEDRQLSYGHGLSFIGNAILQFVASLIVYSETSSDACNEELETNVRELLRPDHLVTHCQESGWASVLAYNSKGLSVHSKKGIKVYSDQLKAFIGALYASNEMEKLPEVLEVTKKLLTTNTELSFESLVKRDLDIHSLCLGSLLGFGMGMFVMVMMSYLWLYHSEL